MDLTYKIFTKVYQRIDQAGWRGVTDVTWNQTTSRLRDHINKGLDNRAWDNLCRIKDVVELESRKYQFDLSLTKDRI